jgi:glycerol-3-phosphate acyltransferase PlsY
MGYVAVILMGYLLGSSNMAYFLSRIKKKDLTSAGTGNLGASNAVVLMGWKAGVAVAVHDAGKALLAVLLANIFYPDLPYIGAVAGVASVLGHIFPFYLKFKGGKGFAAYIGMTIALNWKLALVILALVVLITVVTDYIVLGTTTTIIAVPISLGIETHSVVLPLILLIATLVILYKHRENYPRIIKGTEIGLRSSIRGDQRLYPYRDLDEEYLRILRGKNESAL